MIDSFVFGRVVIVGDLFLDCYINGSVDRISPEAPVPVLLRAQHTAVPGGAANVAMNAATLGSHVTLIGLVGDDASAHTLKQALSAQGTIETGHIVTDPDWPTITKTRVLSGRQQIVRIDEEQIRTPPDIIRARLVDAARAAIATADVVVCSDYAKGVLSDDVLEAIISTASARGIPVIVDPKRQDFSAYRGAFLVTPNLRETALGTGLPVRTDKEIEEAARVLSETVGGHVLVTRSENGMTLLQRNGRVLHAQVRKAEVYDVSGAGDTVVATMASVLSAGQDLETAVVITTSAASIAVSKLGTATVTRAELSAALTDEMSKDTTIATRDQASAMVEQWHRHGARVVFTNGCFDLVHPGHVALLRAAARQGDKLVVGINSDASVRRLKGESRPLQDEQSRSIVIGAMRDVDMVVVFEEDTPFELVRAIRPDVIVKGADYQEHEVVGGDFVKSCGGSVVLVDIVGGQSTTSIVRKMTVSATSS